MSEPRFVEIRDEKQKVHTLAVDKIVAVESPPTGHPDTRGTITMTHKTIAVEAAQARRLADHLEKMVNHLPGDEL